MTITLKLDNGEAGSDYGFFIAIENGDGPEDQKTVGPCASTMEEWEELGFATEDALNELVERGYTREEIEIED